MKPTVYIDVLFLINFLINIILLYSTAKLASVKITTARCLSASLFSAVYSVLIFFPDFSFIFSAGAKFLSSLVIVAIAYNIKGFRLYAKTLGLFYVVTLCFGGGVFALFYLTGIGSRVGAVIKNGILYFDLPWQFLFMSVLLSYTVISGIWRFVFSGSIRKDTYIDICITYLGKKATIRALIDTGNSLHDPISNAPVIVAEYLKLKDILPEDFNSYFLNGINENFSAELLTRLRIIPFSSLGKENGMLIGFKPDSVTADINERITEINNVIIGISDNQLSKDKNFHALLPPGIIF